MPVAAASCRRDPVISHASTLSPAGQEVGGALRLGGGGEDRPLVGFQHGEPVGEIGGVILARLRGEVEIGGQESRAQFCDQLLEGIGPVGETPAELPVEAGPVSCPVDQLVDQVP